MANKVILFGTIITCAMANSCKSPTPPEQKESKSFYDMAVKESLTPVHPGEPGKTPFWNQYSKRFIYAPAFDYDEIDQAVGYRYDIVSLKDSSRYSFKKDIPYASLSPIWAKLPVGSFNLKVFGISDEGEKVGLAGSGHYYHAAPFAGVYHEPVLPYDSSAMIALDRLMYKGYVSYWLTNKSPDPEYINYRYPAKIWSALIIGAITHARLKPDTEDARRSIALAKIIADYLINISFKEGTPWEYFPPTYFGEHIENHPNPKKPHMRVTTNFTIMGADAGNAYLDLYDYTREKKYLEAAKRIADTYLKTQLDNGSWYQFVNHETNQPIAEPIAIPTVVINFYDRLGRDYGVEGLETSTEKALTWVMDNPVKTFNWQGQFEDVRASKPYKNHSREQACDLAIYLFKSSKNLSLAEELVRFAEDQFVIWEKPASLSKKPRNPGFDPNNWITPSVQEQYVFWQPVGRSAGIMMKTYWEGYKATKKEIYLAKAKSIANAFTLVQKANNGDYPTFFTKYPMNRWLNSTVYPAKEMMVLQKGLQNLSNESNDYE